MNFNLDIDNDIIDVEFVARVIVALGLFDENEKFTKAMENLSRERKDQIKDIMQNNTNKAKERSEQLLLEHIIKKVH